MKCRLGNVKILSAWSFNTIREISEQHSQAKQHKTPFSAKIAAGMIEGIHEVKAEGGDRKTDSIINGKCRAPLLRN